MNNLDAAMRLLKSGKPVFAVDRTSKKPFESWGEYQDRLPMEDEVRTSWSKHPGGNLGMTTGHLSGTVVIDCDSEENGDRFIEEYPEAKDTLQVQTGRGRHFYFEFEEGIRNDAGKLLGPGIDVRGEGGYVVIPPSIHANGKPYRWLNKNKPLALPNKLREILISRSKNGEQPNGGGYRERFDTAQAVAGVPEGQRDSTLFRLACKLRNADVPQEIAERLILESASNCRPPFPESIAREKVARAYATYAPKQTTTKQAEFWPELISAKDLLALPPDPTRWVWDQTLPLGGCSVLVAKPKIGKSTLAVNLAIAVARGLKFLGRDTQQNPVAYLSLDASLPEIAEVFTTFGLKEYDQIFLHAGAAPKDNVGWIMQRVKENLVRLVIIDTLQKLFRFENVNDYSQVINIMEPLLDAAREQKIHLLFTHHAKKDGGDDLDSAIGSTAVRGLAYTYLHLKRLPESEQRILRSDQRGGKNFGETAIGFNKDGFIDIQGTREEVEIDLCIPKIIEALQAEETDPTEREIRRMVPVRGILVSKAIRKMLRTEELTRTGEGKKGSAFRYSVSFSFPL